MRYIFSILFLMTFLSCQNNKTEKKVSRSENKFVGTWKEVLQKMIKGDPKIDSIEESQYHDPHHHLVKIIYDTYFVIRQNGSELEIVSEVTVEDQPYKCDSISSNGDQLSFRTINQGGTFNHFTLRLNGTKKLSGEMKSFNGNTYEVQYEKMPDNFKIEHVDPSF